MELKEFAKLAAGGWIERASKAVSHSADLVSGAKLRSARRTANLRHQALFNKSMSMEEAARRMRRAKSSAGILSRVRKATSASRKHMAIGAGAAAGATGLAAVLARGKRKDK
ncbi:MAG: hypothetical protein ABFE07_28045 [Armatimonadia bacterium]